jgi:HAD superfamily hydrolase (TIGR01509 family)
MDGLLLDSERIARDAWQRAAQAHGYDMSHDIYLQVVGRHVRDAERIFTELLGADFPFHAARALRLQYGEEYMAQHGLPTRPGAEALLTFLAERDIPRAVATSTAHNEAWRRLERTDLARYFSLLCSGDEVAHGKPAPDLFLLTAERLGVPPETCIVLEDSGYGIQAAHAAGMTPILVPDLKEPSDEVVALAHAVLPSLHEVKAVLAAALGG